MQSLTDERIIIKASSSDYILISHESNRDTCKRKIFKKKDFFKDFRCRLLQGKKSFKFVLKIFILLGYFKEKNLLKTGLLED